MAIRILLLIFLCSCSTYKNGTDEKYDFLKASSKDSKITASLQKPQNSVLYNSKTHFYLTHLSSGEEIIFYNAQGDFGWKLKPGRYALHGFKVNGDFYQTLSPKMMFNLESNETIELGKIFLSCHPWNKTNDKDRLRFRRLVLAKKPREIVEYYLKDEADICMLFRQGQ